MLADYARYIENIRNGLIQCGVIFPQIEDIDMADYETLFHIGEKISDIMYFYKIMVCSGNMEGMFVPTDKSYRGTIRSEAFLEFKEDILPLLKEQLGDEDPDSSFAIDTLCDLGSFVEEDEPEEWVNDDIPVEDTVIELDDLFGDDKPEDVHVSDQFVSSGASLWGTGNTEWVSDGADLFGSNTVASASPPIDYVDSGTELFSIVLNSDIKKKKVSSETVDYVSHGIELFSIPIQTVSEDIWEDEPQDIWVDDTLSEDIFEEDDQDSWVSDEDGQGLWEENPEDIWVDDGLSDDVFVDDDQDVWVGDEDYEDSPVDGNHQGTWVSEDDDDPQDIWVDEEDSDDIWEDTPSVSGQDADIWEDEPDVNEIFTTPKPVVVSKPTPKPVKVVNPDRDIVDSVQDAASAALTSAKRFLANITNPKK